MAFPVFAVGKTTSPFSGAAFDPHGEDFAIQRAQQAQTAVNMDDARSTMQAGQAMQGLGKDVLDYAQRIREQEAITYTLDKRNKMMVQGQKAILDWQPTAYGPEGLKAGFALQEKLSAIKDSLLKDAPTTLAQQRAIQEVDSQVAQFMTHGERYARDQFGKYTRDQAATAEEGYLGIIAKGGSDPNLYNSTVQAAKDMWKQQGEAGIVFSPAESEMMSKEFEKKAAYTNFQSQLNSPKFAQKAINEFNSGAYNDIFDAKQVVQAEISVNHKVKEIRAEAERAQAEARGRLAEQQDKLAYTVWEDIKKNPDGARTRYGIDAISALVDSGKLRPAQAQHFYEMAQGIEKKADPGVLAEMRRMAVDVISGEVKPDVFLTALRNNEKFLGDQYYSLAKDSISYIGKDSETLVAKKQIDTMFNSPDQRSAKKLDQTYSEYLAGAKVEAEKYIEQRRIQGVPGAVALEEARLKYSPDINYEPSSKYISYIPDSPEDVKPLYSSLYNDLVSGSLSQDAYVKQFKTLSKVYENAGQRQAIINRINSFSKVGK